MRRIYVYSDRHEADGKVLIVGGTIEELKKEIARYFDITQSEVKLYSKNGCEILDTRVIRDDEKVYLSPADSLSNTETESNNLETSMKDFKMSDTSSTDSSGFVSLNVGGRVFTTSKSTLTFEEPSSMLARMFSEDNSFLMSPRSKDSNGAVLIDRSPVYFEPILNYLRHGSVILDSNVNPRGVLAEALFYGIESMVPTLQAMIDKYEDDSKVTNYKPLTRSEVVKSIIMTSITSELRFQGVNLAGADLNKLDLRGINFKYACLTRCNLSGANLSNCCLERADLSDANLEGATLLGVKALCANMEGANLRNCNMEDPSGSRAILEGVNLKGANLDGSNMAGVNLRVATLKYANMQNCILRTAILAGADLEFCDLSGSDLHEANLRGANLKDAAFELMLTPLHMSQTIR